MQVTEGHKKQISTFVRNFDYANDQRKMPPYNALISSCYMTGREGIHYSNLENSFVIVTIAKIISQDYRLEKKSKRSIFKDFDWASYLANIENQRIRKAIENNPFKDINMKPPTTGQTKQIEMFIAMLTRGSNKEKLPLYKALIVASYWAGRESLNCTPEENASVVNEIFDVVRLFVQDKINHDISSERDYKLIFNMPIDINTN